MAEQHIFVIGRSRRADIPLADPTVSSRHAELTFLPGGKVLLTDCRSTNGTYRIAATDTLRFGRFTLSARALFEALRMRLPPTAGNGVARPQTPAVAGEHLVRGVCGHVKPADGPCPECGQ